jgi:hypothetical protein
MSYARNKQTEMTMWGALTAQLSTNSYVDLSPVIDVSFFRSKILRFTAATNALLVNVLGSLDGGVTFDQTVEADISVTTSAVVTKTYTSPYTHLKMQVKAASGGSQGTLSTKYFCSWC